MPPRNQSGEAGIGDLLGRARADAQRLIEAELDRLRGRIAGHLANAKVAAILIGAAAVLGLAAFGALLVGLILTLATRLGPGWATLIVCGASFLVAGVLGWLGTQRIARTVATQRAEAESRAARADAAATIGVLRDRLTPAALAEQARRELSVRAERLADTGVAKVRAHPATVAVAAGAVALFLARRPLVKLVRRLRQGDEPVQPDGRRRVQPKGRNRGAA